MKSFKNIISLAIIIITGVLGIIAAKYINTSIAMINPNFLVVSFPATIIIEAAVLSTEVKVLNKINMLNINI